MSTMPAARCCSTADPGSATLYLDDEELSLSGGTVTGTRYYTVGSTTIATRTGAAAVSFLAGDQQGTSNVAISAASLAVTRRYYDPYGNPLGTSSASFPAGEKGFVGGADDAATGLTDLGVREYQPDTGSFISTDPIQNSVRPRGPQRLRLRRRQPRHPCQIPREQRLPPGSGVRTAAWAPRPRTSLPAKTT